MNPIKKQATSIAGRSALSTETKLSFGAAGGCLVLGMIGYAINALTTTETTLSAFLVIGVFYLMLGVVSLLKGKPDYAQQEANVLPAKRTVDFEREDYAEEAAA